MLQDGSRLPVASVLWCTGFRPDYRWLAVPGALTDQGEPVHTGGASPIPGLHWVGLPWQTRLAEPLQVCGVALMLASRGDAGQSRAG